MRILAWLPRLRAGVPAGAVGYWRPRLSLAFSTTAAAVDLNRRQWLLVVGVFLAFMFLIVPVVYVVRLLMDRLEQAEIELKHMSGTTDLPTPSHLHRTKCLGATSHASIKFTPSASDVSETPRPSPRLPSKRSPRPAHEAEGTAIPEGDELDQAAPGASESGTAPRMAASAPIGARDAEDGQGAVPPGFGNEGQGGRFATAAPAAPGPDAEHDAHFVEHISSRLEAQHAVPHAHHHRSGAVHHAHHHMAGPSVMRKGHTESPRGHRTHETEHSDAAGTTEGSPSDADSVAENPDMHKVEGDSIVDDMGISGMCLVCNEDKMRTVIVVAGQAFVLQALILYYIATALQSHPRLNREKGVPVSVVYAAIYIQFICVVNDLPRSIFVARWFHQLHDKWKETIVFGFIFTVDAFVIPLAQLFIGALFLCTSVTVVDVLMNSFALSYISEIDNMILTMRKTLNELSSDDEEFDNVEFPVNQGIIRALTTAIVIVPVIPMTFSFTMAYLGLKVFML